MICIARAMTILLAIASYEGFNKTGSRAQRNNNPGNINFSSITIGFGAVLETIPAGIDETPRFAKFPSEDSGFACLRELLTRNYLGMSIIAAFNKYAPPTENNTSAYAQFVCDYTGLALETVLTTENIG